MCNNQLVLMIFAVLALGCQVVSYSKRAVTLNRVGLSAAKQKFSCLAMTPFQADLKKRVINDELIGADRQMLRRIVRQVRIRWNHELLVCF